MIHARRMNTGPIDIFVSGLREEKQFLLELQTLRIQLLDTSPSQFPVFLDILDQLGVDA